MPIIKSAKKKLKQDRKKSINNAHYAHAYKQIIKKVKKGDKKISLKSVYSIIDKAAQKKIIHAHKAQRLKSQIARTYKKST
ncbi:MAG TPA: 30S ribosomal protein S20 [Patescibacteria group bacterium]|nr:30S ribosomal protein S20 [Patescibacteria group bacterium]